MGISNRRGRRLTHRTSAACPPEPPRRMCVDGSMAVAAEDGTFLEAS